ncbi:MAG: hypothetical protein ACRDOO_23055, partial [Actinomadura sp.]
LPFASLADVITYKKRRGWKKDRDDVDDIERWLAMNELLKGAGGIEQRRRPKGHVLINSPAT